MNNILNNFLKFQILVSINFILNFLKDLITMILLKEGTCYLVLVKVEIVQCFYLWTR